VPSSISKSKLLSLELIQAGPFYQYINPVKYNQYRRYAQPVRMNRIADLPVKKVNNGMPKPAARAPGYTHKL